MLLEALEILQNSGTDVEALVTDLGIYKVVQILTVYLPLATATFLLSQEFIGEKIACFPPSNFSDFHADPLQEYCWNEGRWISSELARERTGIYTQPHRYYPLYLPLQAILFLTPIIIWNILTKSKLLAALKGTEEFLDDLLEDVTKGTGAAVKKKAIILIKQFHETCISTAENLNMAAIGCARLGYEMLLLVGAVYMQFKLYNRNPKTYHCWIPELTDEEISCTVPILDMLDSLWSINVGALLASAAITMYMIWRMYVMHVDEFQPLFYNNLPYGDEDEFNEEIKWESTWIKHSYRLLIKIFMENNQIMTRAVVLQALQPDERKRGWKLRLQAKRANLRRRQRRALSPTVSPRSMSPGSLTPQHENFAAWPKEKTEKKTSSKVKKDTRGDKNKEEASKKSETATTNIEDPHKKDNLDGSPQVSTTDSGIDSAFASQKETIQTALNPEQPNNDLSQSLDPLNIIKEEQTDQMNPVQQEGNHDQESGKIVIESAIHTESGNSATELNVNETFTEVSYIHHSEDTTEIESPNDSETTQPDYLGNDEIEEANVEEKEPVSPSYVSSFRISLRVDSSPSTQVAGASMPDPDTSFSAEQPAEDASTDFDASEKPQLAPQENQDLLQNDSFNSSNIAQARNVRSDNAGLNQISQFVQDENEATTHPTDESQPQNLGGAISEVNDTQNMRENDSPDMEKSSDSDLLAEYEQIQDNSSSGTKGDAPE